MWKKTVEIWSYKKTLIYDDEGNIVQEEDQDAWAESTVSEEEVEEGFEL